MTPQSLISTPLRPANSQHKTLLSAEQLEGTPVGDHQNKEPKVQLCIELRKKDAAKRSKTQPSQELVLEVAVMYIKNLRRQGKSKMTFVKIMFDGAIYSTELKMDKQNEGKVDFIEVFGFPLKKVDDLKGKVMELQVCDKKMTRNAAILGQVKINVEELKIGKPVCEWFKLNPGSETSGKIAPV